MHPSQSTPVHVMLPDPTVNRRQALRQLLSDATRGAQQVTGLRGWAQPRRGAITNPEAPPTLAGRPARARVSREMLLEWAAGEGLSAHLTAIDRLARLSLRVTPAGSSRAPTGRSVLGGVPDLASRDWPKWRDEELRFLVQFDLAALDPHLIAQLPLPESGRLLLFTVEEPPSGLAPEDLGSTQAIWIPAEAVEGASPRPDPGESGMPLELSPELALPRVWFQGVQEIGLSESEIAAWERLRERLASAQGVALHDRLRGFLALTRVFGYPDEKSGNLRLSCELLDRGVNLANGERRARDLTSDAESASSRWELLAQLSRGSSASPSWGPEGDRLYAWLPVDSMRAGRFARPRVIRR